MVAWAIRCYSCEPDFSAPGGSAGITRCSNVSSVIECIGSVGNQSYDSCFSLLVSLHHPSYSDLEANLLNRTVQSVCTPENHNQLQVCGNITASLSSGGGRVHTCDGFCCQDDLCNDTPTRATSVSTTATVTGPPTSITTSPTTKSSGGSIDLAPTSTTIEMLILGFKVPHV